MESSFDFDQFKANQVEKFKDLRKLGLKVKLIEFPFKKPPLFSDEEFSNMDDEEIIDYIKTGPVNLAIMTGMPSGIVAVDADSNEAMKWVQSNLPPTPFKTLTPKGSHYLYRVLNEQVKNSVKFDCPKLGKTIDLDIRGKNGYVMAPGSLHPADHLLSSEDYKTLSDGDKILHALESKVYYQEESELSDIEYTDIPEFSNDWFKTTEPIEEVLLEAKKDVGHLLKPDERLKKRVQAYLETSKPAIEGKGGDTQTFKIACDLVNGFALTKDVALEFMLEFFNPKCVPPWNKEELESKIENASKYGDLDSGYLLRDKIENIKLETQTNLLTIDEFLELKQDDVHWLVSNMLPMQGTSLLFAKPKTGKTTLIHQLAVSVAEGKEFLSREVTRGKVLLLNLEDNLQMKRKLFNSYSAEAKKNISLYTGHYLSDPPLQLEMMIRKVKPSLVIIDTVQKFLNISDANDYSLVYYRMSKLNNLSRKFNCHIVFLHHANKGSVGSGFDSIMGSTAFRATVDLSISMTEENGHRFIMSEGRYGSPIPKTQIKFDPDTGAVTLGTMDEEDLVTENAENKILSFLKKTNDEIKYSDLQNMVGLRKSIFLKAFKTIENEKVNVVTRGKGKGVKYVSLVLK